MEAKIKESLITLVNGIRTSDDRVILEEMTKLDQWMEEERGKLSPQLAHFLERRSYAKALALLGGESPAAGTCAPRTGPTGK